MTYLKIIQARSSYSRLLRKSLLPIAGVPLALLCAIRAKIRNVFWYEWTAGAIEFNKRVGISF
jgi:hypothetical protein